MSTTPWIEKLELSVDDSARFSPEQGSLISIAISMKRIADVFEQCNTYGEVGSQAIGNSIVRALRDGVMT